MPLRSDAKSPDRSPTARASVFPPVDTKSKAETLSCFGCHDQTSFARPFASAYLLDGIPHCAAQCVNLSTYIRGLHMRSAPNLSGLPNDVTVVRLREAPDPRGASEAIEAIFFESSGGGRFNSEASRAAFRERWLGRYLTHYPQYVFVALTPGNEVIGYLVGCLDDPSRNSLFRTSPTSPSSRI